MPEHRTGHRLHVVRQNEAPSVQQRPRLRYVEEGERGAWTRAESNVGVDSGRVDEVHDVLPQQVVHVAVTRAMMEREQLVEGRQRLVRSERVGSFLGGL